MEVLIAIIVGVIFTIAVYLMLSRNIIRVVLGAILLSDGYHLLLLMMTGLQNGAAPFLNIGEDTFVGSVPQALILYRSSCCYSFLLITVCTLSQS